MPLGDRLRDLRKKHDLTRKELADKLKLTYAALSKYETNEREPDYETLQKIADFFRVSTDYLLNLDSALNSDVDSSPKERFTKFFESLSPEEQKEVAMEVFQRVLEEKTKKK